MRGFYKRQNFYRSNEQGTLENIFSEKQIEGLVALQVP